MGDATRLSTKEASKPSEISALEKELRYRDFQISILKEKNNEKDVFISKIKSSLPWKALIQLRNVLRALKKFLGKLLFFKNTLLFLRPYLLKFFRAPKDTIAALKSDLGISSTTPNRFWESLKIEVGNIERYKKWQAINKSEARNFDSFATTPSISVILPISKSTEHTLQETIQLLQKQAYPNWRLYLIALASASPTPLEHLEQLQQKSSKISTCIFSKPNSIHEAINSALEAINDGYVIFLNPKDSLSEDCFFWLANSINQYPNAKLFYTDEDRLDTFGRRHAPYFKCELNYELLLTHNMLGQLTVYDISLLKELKGFNTNSDIDQNYDLVLRAVEKLKFKQIKHIPKVLVHCYSGSKLDTEASINTVQSHLDRTHQKGTVVANPEAENLNKIIFEVPSPLPLVSIIILTKDKAGLLKQCLRSILEKTSYTNYEIIIVDNGSEETETFELFEQYKQENISILSNNMPFNFSALNNRAVQQAKGELICLLNNDIEVLTPGWLEELVSFAIRPHIGCVGARLWYPDMRLQHGGILLGIGDNLSEHSHKYLNKGKPGYFGRAVTQQSLSAVTAACLVIRKSTYLKVNGLDESLRVAFNDIDFCLRVQKAGFRNVWTPFAELLHHESASRGNDFELEKQARFFEEKDLMQSRWGSQLSNDPAYSPNLTRNQEGWLYKTE